MRKSVAIAIVVVGVILAGIVVLSRPGGGQATHPRGTDDEAAGADALGEATTAPKEIADKIRLGASSLGDADQRLVASALEETIQVYSTGTLEEWVASMSASGIAPPDGVMARPEAAAAHWERTRQVLARSEIDVNAIRVFEVKGDEPTSSHVRRATRDAGREFIHSIPRRDRRVVGVELPGTFVGTDNQEFSGRLRFEMTWNPELKCWTLTALEMEGVPNGVQFPTLML